MLLDQCHENFVRKRARLPEFGIGTNDDVLLRYAPIELNLFGVRGRALGVMAEQRAGDAQQRVFHVEFFAVAAASGAALRAASSGHALYDTAMNGRPSLPVWKDCGEYRRTAPLLSRQQRSRKKFAILLLVEPRAFDIEQAQAGQPSERKRIQGQLRDRFIGARVGLVVEDVHRAVADLDEIDVAGEDARLVALGQQLDAVFDFQRLDIRAGEPNRNFDGDRYAVVGEHEAL